MGNFDQGAPSIPTSSSTTESDSVVCASPSVLDSLSWGSIYHV